MSDGMTDMLRSGEVKTTASNCPIPGYCTTCDADNGTSNDWIQVEPINVTNLDPVDQELARFVPMADAPYQELARFAPVADALGYELPHPDRMPLTASGLILEGFTAAKLRLDLVDSKLYVGCALTPNLIRQRFLAGKTVRIGADMPDATQEYFLELQLGERGLEIEDLEALDAQDPVQLEMVAVIDSYRYLSAESAD